MVWAELIVGFCDVFESNWPSAAVITLFSG
jgi:hypothetical protein